MPVIAPDVISAVQNQQVTWQILSSVQLAQWADESGWGKVVTGTFNFFGIKAEPGQPFTMCPTHEDVNGVRVPITAPFRNFASFEEAFADHACLLATGEPYQAAYPLRADYQAYALAMGPRYATRPGYGQLLIQIIQEEGLLQYDQLPTPQPTPGAVLPVPANDPDPVDQVAAAIGQST